MQQARAAATREAVLAAAARVFERHGFAGASISEILDEAGVTKGALYFHFASKEDLARAIVNEQANWRDANAAPSGQQPVQAMIDMSSDFVAALQRDPLFRASIRLTLERNTFASTDDSPYRGWLSTVEGMLRQARDCGDLVDGVDPGAAAYLLTAAMTGIQLFSEATTQRADLVARVDDMWRILLPALFRPQAVPEGRRFAGGGESVSNEGTRTAAV